MNIRSDNPIKPRLVAAMKAMDPSISRITDLRIVHGVYKADALAYNSAIRKYTRIGEITATGDGDVYPFNCALLRNP